MQINTKVSCKLISKVFHKVILSLLMGMIKHSQNTQSGTSAISLQYLKREVKDVEHQSFYKLALSFLMEVARHVQSTQNRKFVISEEKGVTTTFVFYCDAKYSDILRGSNHVRCYLI